MDDTTVLDPTETKEEKVSLHTDQEKNTSKEEENALKKQQKSSEQEQKTEEKEEEKEVLFTITQKDFQQNTKDILMPDILKFFRPELINRFDDVVFFHPLRKEDLLKIVDIMIREPREMLREKNIEIHISQNAKVFLSEQGYNTAFGARPLRRAIQEYIEDPLSDALIRRDFVNGDTIYIDKKEGEEELFFKKDVADSKSVEDLDPFLELETTPEKNVKESKKTPPPKTDVSEKKEIQFIDGKIVEI